MTLSLFVGCRVRRPSDEDGSSLIQDGLSMPASHIRRRTFLASLATAGVVLPRLSPAADATGFTFETVKNQALALAKQPYRADPSPPLPQVLKDLDYALHVNAKKREASSNHPRS